MESPYIIFRTAAGDYHPSNNGHEKLTDFELESLLQGSRDTVLLFEAALKKRQIATNPELPDTINECCTKLQKSLTNLKILGRFDSRDTQSVKLAAATLGTTQENRNSKVYQVFLSDILRHCGRGLAMLCAASIGKYKMVALNTQDRTSFVYYIKNNKARLDSPILDILAVEFDFPDETGKSNSTFAHTDANYHRSAAWLNNRITKETQIFRRYANIYCTSR